jgi:hypothetical protein
MNWRRFWYSDSGVISEDGISSGRRMSMAGPETEYFGGPHILAIGGRSGSQEVRLGRNCYGGSGLNCHGG